MKKELIKWGIFLILATLVYVIFYFIGGTFLKFMTNDWIPILVGVVVMIFSSSITEKIYEKINS